MTRRAAPLWRTQAWRLLALAALCLAALQLYFVLRVALMVVVDPASTSFQRSAMWRMASQQGQVTWAQAWTPITGMADHLKRAVIASEDAGFTEHTGVEWDAIERAWENNQRVAESPPSGASRRAKRLPGGGSTISQQLVKNLFLSGERTVLRKGQELLITMALEGLLTKRRILEIYLNHVEWGEGLYGASMAARYYHRVDVARLSRQQAARLAVMLPAPRRFERRPHSPYLVGRAAVIEARMAAVESP